MTVKAEELHHKSCRPFALAAHKSTEHTINHGNSRFRFDIKAFCDDAIRVRRLAEGLPQELVHIIFQHYIDDVSGITDMEAIHRLSTVSRYYYNMCHDHTLVRKTVSLTSHREMVAAASLGIFTRTQGIITKEDSRKPWLHILFTRSHLPSATSALVQNWICDYNNCEFRHSMDLNTFAWSHRFDNLSRLEIRRRRFKNWTQFAKLIFSLSHLEHLTISDVDWDSSPKVPPSWLKFQGRLRSFRCSNIRAPHSWLFIAGQPRNRKKFWGPTLLASEIPVSAKIFEAVMKDCELTIDRFDFEHQADGE